MIDIEKLTHHAKSEPKDLNSFEHEQRILYLTEKTDRKKAQMLRILKEKQDAATKASNKDLVPIRRRVVARATKPELKKKTPPKVTDSEQEDRLKYLGEVANTLDGMMKQGKDYKPDPKAVAGRR